MSSSSVPAPLGFQELGLEPLLLQTLTKLGFEQPTPIQQQALPPMLAGQDVLAQAATGTGKTAAFGLPMVQRLLERKGKSAPCQPRGLVLTPTRELASQVANVLKSLTAGANLQVGCITGGQSMSEQLRALRTGLDIVVATPGRLCDHIDRKSIVLQSIALIVLDEADEMLDKGFAEDLDRILSQLPPERQIGLFSATLPPRMEALANKHMRTPVRIHLTKSHQTTQQQPNITQISYLVESGFKQAALARILHMEEPASAIVFCHTRDEVDQLVHHLSQRGIGCAALHGGLSQPQRDKVLQRFRKGHLPLLVATDVAARGLDVDHVSHVINYAIPGSFETYVHRIGRTGRAGRKGVALTLLSPRERRWPLMLKRACGAELAMQAIPTSSQLRERRLSNAKARIEQLLAETCEPSLQLVAEQLTTSPEEARWAAVALQLAQAQLSGKEDFVDIPLVSADQGKYRNDGPYPSNGGPRRGGGYGGGGGGGGSRRSFGGNAYGGYNRSSSKDGWQNRGERGRPSRPGSESSSEQGASGHGQEPTRRWSKEQPPAYGAGPSKRRKTGGPFVANSTPERGGKGGKSFARPGSKPRSSERPSERTVRH